MRHAATAVCWLSTEAIFRQPSILRNLICPLATRLKSRTTAAVLRQNLIPLSGRRRPTLSRQAKECLGDCRQEGRQAVRARRAATEGRWTFRGWGGEQPNGRTGPIVANRVSWIRPPVDVAMVEATDFPNRDDLAEFRQLHWAAVGRILGAREVGARPVGVRE